MRFGSMDSASWDKIHPLIRHIQSWQSPEIDWSKNTGNTQVENKEQKPEVIVPQASTKTSENYSRAGSSQTSCVPSCCRGLCLILSCWWLLGQNNVARVWPGFKLNECADLPSGSYSEKNRSLIFANGAGTHLGWQFCKEQWRKIGSSLGFMSMSAAHMTLRTVVCVRDVPAKISPAHGVNHQHLRKEDALARRKAPFRCEYEWKQ